MEDADSPWAGVDRDALSVVSEVDQAAIIADPGRALFLRPFLGVECTVSRAAAQLGVSPNVMLYRVRRMLAARLLHVVREEPRGGRPVKVYRSVHDGYLVPMDAMPYLDLRHRVSRHGRLLVEQLTTAYTAVLARSGTSGARFLARNDRGDVWSSDLVPNLNHRRQPVHFSDATVWLTRDEAAQVRRVLIEATDRALSSSRSNTAAQRDPYLLVTAILPTGT